MIIKQGDIFWVNLGSHNGSEPGNRHPHVVIQNDVFNASHIDTVVVCALTTNLKRAQAPGNVTLKKGEASLAKKSVVNISQMVTLECALTDGTEWGIRQGSMKEVSKTSDRFFKMNEFFESRVHPESGFQSLAGAYTNTGLAEYAFTG